MSRPLAAFAALSSVKQASMAALRCRVGWIAPALAAIWLAACSSSSDTTNAASLPTLIVDPSAFLGDVPCSDQAGAIATYVATLTDTKSSKRLDSPMIACASRVSFLSFVVGDCYTLEIKGYEQGG